MTLEGLFPGLRSGEYRVVSPQTTNYNCIAWAAGDTERWWWPTGPYYWPTGAPRERTMASFIAAFEGLGYVSCPNGDPEPGMEKVALYASDAGPEHAARQLADGRWVSKLGRLEDIEHATVNGVEGAHYGRVVHYMRRARGSGID